MAFCTKCADRTLITSEQYRFGLCVICLCDNTRRYNHMYPYVKPMPPDDKVSA